MLFSHRSKRLITLHPSRKWVAHLEENDPQGVHLGILAQAVKGARKNTYINLLTVITREARLHFRCDIVRCSKAAREAPFKIRGCRGAHSSHKLPTGGKAKVADARVVGYINEDVIWFEVAVYDAVAMDMAQSVQDLTEQAPGDVNIVVQTIPYQVAESLGYSQFT